MIQDPVRQAEAVSRLSKREIDINRLLETIVRLIDCFAGSLRVRDGWSCRHDQVRTVAANVNDRLRRRSPARLALARILTNPPRQSVMLRPSTYSRPVVSKWYDSLKIRQDSLVKHPFF